MTTKTIWNLDRWEDLVLRAYLTVGAFVCGLTGLMVALGKSPIAVESSLLAAGVVVGSPSGDTRVLLVLNIMLLAAFLIHSQKAPIKAG
jgi:hypothetical protein